MYTITTSDGLVYPYDYEHLEIAQDRVMEMHKAQEEDPTLPSVAEIHVEPLTRSFCGMVTLAVFVGLRPSDMGGLRHMAPCTTGYALLERLMGEPTYRNRLKPGLGEAISERMHRIHMNLSRRRRVVEHVLRRRFDDLLLEAFRHDHESVPAGYFAAINRPIRFIPAPAPTIPPDSQRALEDLRRAIAEGRIHPDENPTPDHGIPRFGSSQTTDHNRGERPNGEQPLR